MYTIYADGVCIYNDVFSLDDMKVVNPKLTLEDNAAGSLSICFSGNVEFTGNVEFAGANVHGLSIGE